MSTGFDASLAVALSSSSRPKTLAQRRGKSPTRRIKLGPSRRFRVLTDETRRSVGTSQSRNVAYPGLACPMAGTGLLIRWSRDRAQPIQLLAPRKTQANAQFSDYLEGLPQESARDEHYRQGRRSAKRLGLLVPRRQQAGMHRWRALRHVVRGTSRFVVAIASDQRVVFVTGQHGLDVAARTRTTCTATISPCSS